MESSNLDAFHGAVARSRPEWTKDFLLVPTVMDKKKMSVGSLQELSQLLKPETNTGQESQSSLAPQTSPYQQSLGGNDVREGMLSLSQEQKERTDRLLRD